MTRPSNSPLQSAAARFLASLHESIIIPPKTWNFPMIFPFLSTNQILTPSCGIFLFSSPYTFLKPILCTEGDTFCRWWQSFFLHVVPYSKYFCPGWDNKKSRGFSDETEAWARLTKFCNFLCRLPILFSVIVWALCDCWTFPNNAALSCSTSPHCWSE